LQEMQNHLASLLSSLKLGPGLDPASQMGPLIDAAGQARVMKLLKDANKTDEILCDCSPVEGGEGFFLTPGLIYAPDKKSVFYREEVFGPLLVIDGFDDEDEAIAKANDTRYGLAASVWSSDLRKSQRVANALESGTVWINSHGRTFPEIENGGYKESGIGRLHGVEGLSEFLQTKHISYSTSG
jgi:betaine-aldehyde dehydrogenase